MSFKLSIYIPSIKVNISENIIKEEFKNLLGEVNRVDFTCLNKKPGFYENTENNFKSAFVHFNIINVNYSSNNIFQTIINGESFKFIPSYSKKEYWILLKAKNPIENTFMNNAQIVENCRFLENKIEEQNLTLLNLRENIEILYNLINKTLVSTDNINKNISYLDRIESLEQKVKALTDFDFLPDFGDEIQDSLILKRKQDIYLERNLSNLSLNSINGDLISPSFINTFDYDNYNELSVNILDLEEKSNSSSEERVKSSIHLCGND